MELRELLVLLHVLAAATWFGAHIVEIITPSLAARQGQAVEVGWLRITAAFAPRLYVPSVVLLLGTGIWLVVDSPTYTFGSLFVTIGLTILIVATIMGAGYLTPTAVKAADAFEAGDSARAGTLTKRLAVVGAVSTVLLLVAFVAMLGKYT